MNLFVEIAGWTGSILILAAFALNINGKVTANSAIYQWMNIIGSIGFIINSTFYKAYPSAALNVVWAIIGLVAVFRGMKTNTQTHNS